MKTFFKKVSSDKRKSERNKKTAKCRKDGAITALNLST